MFEGFVYPFVISLIRFTRASLPRPPPSNKSNAKRTKCNEQNNRLIGRNRIFIRTFQKAAAAGLFGGCTLAPS